MHDPDADLPIDVAENEASLESIPTGVYRVWGLPTVGVHGWSGFHVRPTMWQRFMDRWFT